MRKTLSAGVLALFAVILSGCAFLDAADRYHYIGIYEVHYKRQPLDAQQLASEFDRFSEALKKSTGYELKEIMRDGYFKMSRVIVPQDVKTGLDRVVVTESRNEELSISIIKVPAGEDAETLELKQHIESAFRAAGISDWTFYIQRSHGQIFNN